MPELAEVEYYRTCWLPGLGQRITRIALHGEKRIFRGSDWKDLQQTLRGATLLGSETHGKQIVFRFSRGGWLGVHLGMTGKLHVQPPDFVPARHDHLALYQKKQTLVFSDARMFGRVRFHHGKSPPLWWANLPPAVTSPDFTLARLREIFLRRPRTPLKALLLDQAIFPGVGNWMADEILWQLRLHPRVTAAQLPSAKIQEFWRVSRAICRTALKTIGVDWGDPPPGWLLHERFKTKGHCPRDRAPLRRSTIAGRTTAWCPRCQMVPMPPRAKSRPSP